VSFSREEFGRGGEQMACLGQTCPTIAFIGEAAFLVMNIYDSRIDPWRALILITALVASILVGYWAYRRAVKREKIYPSFEGFLYATGILAAVIVGFWIDSAIHRYHPGPLEIVRRHYEAIGGVDNIAGAMPMFCEGYIQDTVGKSLGHFRFWYDSSGRYRKEVEVGGRRIRLGFDGQRAWQVVDTVGELTVDEWPVGFWYADLILQDYVYPDTGLTDRQVLFQVKSHEPGSTTYQLRFPERNRRPYQIGVYDASSYLQTRRMWLPWRKDYWAFYASTFSDYREVNGTKFPFHVKVQVSPDYSMARTRIFQLSVSRIEVHCPVESGLWLEGCVCE
jgi:hypothetical protein